jgi:cytochrome c-type biogenesis protein CcmF
MSWTLISWSFLTLGLMTGGIWAYYELGWGGYWFWDPVENIALLPWLLATAMIHWGKGRPLSSRGFELLTMLVFLFVLWGTTLTRGGLLMSVHSFSSLPSRTLPLLIMTLIWTFVSLAFGGTSLKVSQNGKRDPFDVNLLSKTPILFLSTVAVIIAFGTFAPPLFAPSVSVDPSFYNSTLWILMIGPFALMPLIPFWGRFKEIFPFFLLAAGVFWILLFFVTFPSVKSALCLGLSV